MLLVDISGSEFFGTDQKFKRDVITEIAATLSFSALQNNDKVGVLLFSDQVELFIPPKKGKSHVLRIIRELIEFKPKSRKTDIAAALKFLSSIMKKRAIVFMLSDFMDDNYEQTLKIAAKKHDLTGIRIFDKHDEEIPNLGMVPMLDSETGTVQLINTASKSVRISYKTNALRLSDYYTNMFKRSGAGTVNTRVDENYVKKLLGYFKHKGR